MTYADKLEKLADEASGEHSGSTEGLANSHAADCATCNARMELMRCGFMASDVGRTLARKVAALVRAASDLFGPVESGLNMGQVFLRNEQAREKLRNALADIEGEGQQQTRKID